MFSEIGETAIVGDLVLTNLNYRISNWYYLVGGLAGENGGIIKNVCVNGSIRGGAAFLGGLVGANGTYETAIISFSHASVAINFAINTTQINQTAGGLVGQNDGTIELSSADGPVRGSVAGGLVGENDRTIVESFATGPVSVGYYLGGLVGAELSTTGVQNSYATGSVRGVENGQPQTGGLIGQDDGLGNAPISSSYATGLVRKCAYCIAGGFVGSTTGGYHVTSSYWDTTTTKTDNGAGQGEVPGLTGLTSAQLKSGLPAGFDPTIWAEKKGINHGFPYLINNPPKD
jgi:hypothetical protein